MIPTVKATMKFSFIVTSCALTLSLSIPGSAKELNPTNPLNPPAPVYWCPNRTADQQIAATAEPGCTPLLEEEAKENDEKSEAKPTGREPIKIQNIQNEASRFLADYRRFLGCCANDVGSLDDVDDLQGRASELLKAVQELGLVNMGTSQRGMTLREIIPPIAQARDDLHKLKKRLEGLGEAKDKLGTLGYEDAARERRRIRHEEDSIPNEFRPARPPASARTGAEIDSTTLPNRIGPTINATTLPNASGTDIGDVVSPNSDQRENLKPRRGPDTQDTTLPNRYGTSLGGGNTPASDLPTSIGAEIGTTQGPTGPSTNPSRVGPSIGDSSLNSR